MGASCIGKKDNALVKQKGNSVNDKDVAIPQRRLVGQTELKGKEEDIIPGGKYVVCTRNHALKSAKGIRKDGEGDKIVRGGKKGVEHWGDGGFAADSGDK